PRAGPKIRPRPMDPAGDPPILDGVDVHELIERSQPQPRVGWFGYALGVFLLVVLTSAYVTTRWGNLRPVVDVISRVLMVGIISGMALMTSLTVRRQREEMKRIEALEELVQLRRWPEALETSRAILLQPT